LLTSHAPVILVDPRPDIAEDPAGVEHLRARLQVEVDDRVPQGRVRRDLESADGRHQRAEVVHVQDEVAVDRHSVQRLHRPDERIDAALVVERVDLVAVGRPVGERHVDRVPRQRDERQLRPVRREAHEHQGVRVRTLAV
jgi:hypothetical protein